MDDAYIIRVEAPGGLLVFCIIIHHSMDNAWTELLTNRDVVLAAVNPGVGLFLGFFVSFVSLGLGLCGEPAEREDALALPGHE